MDSRELLDTVFSNYSHYLGYRENGRIYYGDSVKAFSVTYTRPRMFKLEWSDETIYRDNGRNKEVQRELRVGQSQIWSTRNHIFKKLFYDDRVEELQDLQTAVSGHFLSGFRLILTTSALLQPAEFDGADTLLNMRPFGEIEEGSHLGKKCLIIAGTMYSPCDTEVWLDPKTLSIVRSRQKVWFAETLERAIADGIPKNETLPFNYDCHYDSSINQ